MKDIAISYPQYVKKILSRIEEAGFEGFVVGGAVRDAILNRSVNDFDVTTSAFPPETAEIFSDMHVILTGLKHGTVTVICDKNPVEITTYRFDGDYKDKRHPDRVKFTRNIEDDLARRDFTVNAMAYSEKRGLVDLYGGIEDLNARLIRAVGEPERRFTEDALRIMRAFRFSAKLGFEIEPMTLEAARVCREGLREISVERKVAELEGIMLGQYAKKALISMAENGIFEIIAPDIKLDISRLERVSELPFDFSCRMAFCLIGQENADKYISSLRLSNAVSGRIRKLVALASEPIDLDSDPKLRRLMSKAGDALPHLLEIKKSLGENTEGIAERAEIITERGDCLDVKSLAINGKDLSELGIAGKAVGNTLSYLLECVLDRPELNTREALLKLTK